jgi:hypothetical protein
MAFNSFFVLGMEDLDFSNMDLILNPNFMPWVCGSFKTADSRQHIIARLECRFITEKFKPFIRTVSSVCEKIFAKIKDTFLRVRSWGRQDFVLMIIKQAQLMNMNLSCLLQMFRNEPSTAVKIYCWSELFTDDFRQFWSYWILWSWNALLCQSKSILSLRSTLLASWTILREC